MLDDPKPAAIEQAEPPDRTVTSGRRPGTPAAERKRQQRARDQGALLFERGDLQLFLDVSTLPQKAGCQPSNLRAIVLRELVDNALDAGANVSLSAYPDDTWIITDDGPGLDPEDVPRLFAVNRSLLSSKRKRLPLRGMLGNGLRVVVGAVAASGGSIVVETRGHHLSLAIDDATGTTSVLYDSPIPEAAGLRVYIRFGLLLPPADEDDETAALAMEAIRLARHGTAYRGPSSPWWYSPRDFHMLMAQVSPASTTVARFCRELGFDLDDDRIARELSREMARSRSRLNSSDRSARRPCRAAATLARSGSRPSAGRKSPTWSRRGSRARRRRSAAAPRRRCA